MFSSELNVWLECINQNGPISCIRINFKPDRWSLLTNIINTWNQRLYLKKYTVFIKEKVKQVNMLKTQVVEKRLISKIQNAMNIPLLQPKKMMEFWNSWKWHTIIIQVHAHLIKPGIEKFLLISVHLKPNDDRKSEKDK